jgi:hypothetical protein
MSSPWLEAIDRRIKRAHRHLDTIHDDTRRFIESTKHEFVFKANPNTDETWVVYWVDGPGQLTFDTSITIGEFLYNLRSALDNLICGLVRTVKPDSSCAGRSFPVCVDPDEYVKQAHKVLKGVPTNARRIIDNLQPHLRGNGAEHDPLNILNTLCNRDKHRALRVVSGYTGMSLL